MKIMAPRTFRGALFGVLVISLQAQALTLDEYIQRVKKENKIFRSLTYSIESSNERLTAGDIVLVPTLTAAASLADDASLPSIFGSKREVAEYSLGLSKKFSTGTLLTLSAKTDQYRNDNGNPPFDQYTNGGLGISLQQSLWKDSFGQSTVLRKEREMIINQAETLGVDLKLRSALYDAEATFWDYAVAKDDLRLKKSNLERAKKLENWTSSRVTNGISDRADLMNVKALAAVREVQLVASEDEIKTQETKFREYLSLADGEATPSIEADLMLAQNYFSDLMKKKNVVQISTYLSVLDAKTKKIVADEISDSLRPDISLLGSYNTTSYDRDYTQMTSNLNRTDRPKTFIGVNFTWLFDTDAKLAQKSAAAKEALAAQYLSERNLVLGKNAWNDLMRKYEITQQTVMTLEKVANYQRERAKAEQDKFSKGRTITANVVTAETDAAEAEVTLLKAKSGLRKLEASSVLFIPL